MAISSLASRIMRSAIGQSPRAKHPRQAPAVGMQRGAEHNRCALGAILGTIASKNRRERLRRDCSAIAVGYRGAQQRDSRVGEDLKCGDPDRDEGEEVIGGTGRALAEKASFSIELNLTLILL